MRLKELTPTERLRLYNYLIGFHPRLTVKVLLGYEPDGLDRLTIILGQGSKYDYQLLTEPGFRESELCKYVKQISK